MPTTDEQLISSLLALMRSLERPLSKHVVAENLTVTQFAAMEMLLHKGARTVNDIISGVFSTSGNISVVIENLVKADLLEKKLNPKDGRSRLVTLTAKGRDKIGQYYPKHKREIHRLMQGITATEKEGMIKQIISLRKQIDINNSSDKGSK